MDHLDQKVKRVSDVSEFFQLFVRQGQEKLKSFIWSSRDFSAGFEEVKEKVSDWF